jgi:hypothetical protein
MSRLARLQMAFAPQGPAVRITTQGGRHAVVVNIFIGEGAVAEAAAGEFTTDCPLLTEIYWASAPAVGGNDAGGVSDPHEVTGAARQDGDACELGAPMLTP